MGRPKVGMGCCSLVLVPGQLETAVRMVLANRSAEGLVVRSAVVGGASCSDLVLGKVGSLLVDLEVGSRRVVAGHRTAVAVVVGRKTGDCGSGIAAGSAVVATWTTRVVLRNLGGL